jgi:glycerophosphoryl diester phosphodiesterase
MTLVIAHRGLRSEAPENTLAAFRSALSLLGLHGVEFDVELTADNKAVVVHQETVVPDDQFQRVVPAARDFTSRDWVGSRQCREIVGLDAGSWFDSAFSTERIPTLEDVLNLPWGSVVPFIELKDATFWGERDPERPRRIVDAAYPAIAHYPGTLRVMSFNPAVLSEVRARLKGIVTALELWTEWKDREQEAAEQALACGASYVSVPEMMVLERPQWISTAHAHGLGIFVYPVSPAVGEPEYRNWTPESQLPTWRKLRDLGIDAIMSDFARQSLLPDHGLRLTDSN